MISAYRLHREIGSSPVRATGRGFLFGANAYFARSCATLRAMRVDCTREPYSVIRVTSPAPERSQDITQPWPADDGGPFILAPAGIGSSTAMKNGILSMRPTASTSSTTASIGRFATSNRSQSTARSTARTRSTAKKWASNRIHVRCRSTAACERSCRI